MKKLLPGITAALAAVLAHSFTLQNGFFGDDLHKIVFNTFVRDWANAWRLVQGSYLTTGAETALLATRDIGSGESTYRPLATLLVMVQHSLFGINPFGWHAVSVLLHGANVFLLYILVERLFRDRRAAALAAFFMAFHPVHAETVAGASYQADLAVFFLVVLALLFFVRSGARGEGGPRLASHLLFLAALFFKETAIVLIPILVLYDFFFVFGRDCVEQFRHLRRYAGYVLAALLYAGAYFTVLRDRYGDPLAFFRNYAALGGGSFGPQALVRVVADYAAWFVMPWRPYPVFTHYPALAAMSWLDPAVAAAVVFLAGLLGAAVAARHRYPAVSFAILWFFLALLPVYPISGSFYACRYLYLPGAGAAILFALTFSGSRLAAAKKAGSALILLALAFVTQASAANFCDNVAFWTRHAQIYPDSKTAYANIGLTHAVMGDDLDAAVRALKRAIRLDRKDPRPVESMILCFHKKRDFRSMLHFSRLALTLDERSVRGLNGIATIYGNMGDNQAALEFLDEALKIEPGNSDLLTNLGTCYANLGRYADAKKAWEDALRAYPLNDRARANLAALERMAREK